MNEKRTIAAVSTPVGQGGIGIVRISGAEAEALARKLFRPAKTKHPLKTHRLYLGTINDPQSGRVVDQVLCCYMKAPDTYTREDIVEIHCHGGAVVTARVLELVVRAGAVLADPGEFTKRAFINGRIDLTEAEAVAELISARGSMEAEQAAMQLAGGIRAEVELIRQPLVEILAQIEVALDFPDEDIELLPPAETIQRIEDEALKRIRTLLENYESGRVFREGISVAIVGRPNVGKSSLLNALLKDERSIVTDLPGTTRDIIEAEASFRGIPVTLVDTAGMETTPVDIVEEEGQKRAAERLKGADLVLLVLEKCTTIGEEDARILEAAKNGNIIIVLNKCDLESKIDKQDVVKVLGESRIVEVSAKKRKGLNILNDEIFRIITGAGRQKDGLPGMIPNLRHKNALEKAAGPLERTVEGIKSGLPLEILALEINTVLDEIGVITGGTTPDDVLDEVFSRFCLGK